MCRRACLSLGLLGLGLALVVAAQLAGAASGFRQGGIFRVGVAGASVQIDPQLAYLTTAWGLEYATAAKLFNYPDKTGAAGNRLVPEVASRYRVSRDGRTWTFTIRKGFRFSDGSAVTAESFAYAIDRVANHDLASPGAAFITDPNGTNIVGARAVNDGRARHVRGVVARGNHLVIRLTRPDWTLPTKLAMPFFQATSTKLPLSREVVSGYPSAGPYFFNSHEPGVVTELRRNQYYGGRRSRHLRGVEVRWNLNEQSAVDRVLANELDEGPIPAAQVGGVASRFGVNRARFWAKPTSCLGILVFNSDRPLFKNNVALRRALSWAVDRRAYAAAAPPYTAFPWTHLLPPGFPGSITAKKLQPYSEAPQLRKARRLAAGHFGNGKIRVGYRASMSAPAEIVRRDLIRLGFKSGNITLKGFSGADLYDAMGKRNSELDLGVTMGWCAAFADPELVLGQFPYSLVGYSPKYRRKLEAVKKLKGDARLKALGKLDIELMRDLAPVVVMRTYNSLYFFSARVDPKSLVYRSVYSDWSIPALALK
jgi:ABC-type oligopeptide transport system substrate-binding subunit